MSEKGQQVTVGETRSSRLRPMVQYKSTVQRGQRRPDTIKGSERYKKYWNFKTPHDRSNGHLTGR